MNRPAIAADAGDDRGAIAPRTGRAADAAGSAEAVEIQVRDHSLPIDIHHSAATASSAGVWCWRIGGECSPGRNDARFAPSTHKTPPAPEPHRVTGRSASQRRGSNSSPHHHPPCAAGKGREDQPCGDASLDSSPSHNPTSRDGKSPFVISDVMTLPQPYPLYGRGGGDNKNTNLYRTSSPPSTRRAPVSLERFLLGIHQP